MVFTESAKHFWDRAAVYDPQSWSAYQSVSSSINLLSDADEWSAWDAIGDPVVHIQVRMMTSCDTFEHTNLDSIWGPTATFLLADEGVGRSSLDCTTVGKHPGQDSIRALRQPPGEPRQETCVLVRQVNGCCALCAALPHRRVWCVRGT